MPSLLRVCILAAALAACGGSKSTSPGGNNNLPAVSAKINGAAWQPSIAVTAINAAAGLYSITASQVSGANNYTMVFALYNIKGPGTYPLGVGPNVFGGTATLSRPPSGGWTTPLNGASGEITITTLTATRLVATFSFTADPITSGTTGTMTVTEGALDIPVSGTGGFALPNQGSKVVGTIGGPFNAAVASGILNNPGGASPTLTIVGSNITRSLTISLSSMTGPGTYTLNAGTPIRTIQVSGSPGNPTATWASQVTGGSGSVTISSVTADRIVGSYTATLASLTGGATGSLAVSGTFDVARPF